MIVYRRRCIVRRDGSSGRHVKALDVVRARGILETRMFGSIGIPEIVSGIILAIAAVGFWLFRKGGGRRIL